MKTPTFNTLLTPFGALIALAAAVSLFGFEDVGHAQTALTSVSESLQTVSDARSVAARIDEQLKRETNRRAADHRDSKRVVDDFTFLRRVSFDLIGRPPTLDEIDRFVTNTSPDKRGAIVDRLLDDPQFGENWGRYWRDVIMARRTEPRAIQGSAALVDFLADAFHHGTPWDEIARAFIVAEGDMAENGATAIIAAQGGKPEETVAELARVFLGIQIQCAQCHDHPTDAWTRQQFHELAAFYPRVFMRLNPSGGRRSFLITHRDVPRRFRPNVDRYLGELEHYMADLDDPTAMGTLVEPVFFISGERLPTGTSDQRRRETLADEFTSPTNPWFANAFVNRIWTELIGEGFYEPVDDLGPEREVVEEETLEYLANQFRANGHDVKWLFRVVTSTELYQTVSKPRTPGEPRTCLGTHPQRLRADQVYRALEHVAAFNKPPLPERSRLPLRRGPEFVFGQVFAFDPSEPRGSITGSVPQALLMMNGELLTYRLSAAGVSRFGQLARSSMGDAEIIQQLYLLTLSRPPTRRELSIHRAYIQRSAHRSEAIEDIVWSLVNSSEFLYRN